MRTNHRCLYRLPAEEDLCRSALLNPCTVRFALRQCDTAIVWLRRRGGPFDRF